MDAEEKDEAENQINHECPRRTMESDSTRPRGSTHLRRRRSSTRSTRNDKSQEGRPRTRLSTNGRFDRSNHARYRPDPLAREALAENFSAWVDAVEQCLLEADRHLPKQSDRRELAGFVLTAMGGA